MNQILLVFPHQLFDPHPGLESNPELIVLIEDSLFFGDDRYPIKFHRQKLWLHRASMKRMEQHWSKDGWETKYVEYSGAKFDDLFARKKPLHFATEAEQWLVVDPTDFILEKRIRRAASKCGAELIWLDNPNFLNSRRQNAEYRSSKKRWFMADFYKSQRKRLDVLMDGDQPIGGKWSFDADNRKKVPKNELDSIPELESVKHDEFDEEARSYVLHRFNDNPGKLDQLYYPSSHRGASKRLDAFLKKRFLKFGVYEDAIVEGESWLWHSVLTPMLNIGLLSPVQIIETIDKHLTKQEVPLNSSEGFVRQIIGWREFMRATYEDLGVLMRTTNHWEHHRSIPDSFWSGETGISPIDDTIQRVLKTGYCHHIERLMVLGGFMFICEFDPDEIYKWFMELFVDSYDWVMVPNVYAMSQNADGGLITTKPYFSGSSYIKKMSHYKKGPWCDIWDGLYWRWIWNHAEDLSKNPRWAMMCSMAKKMDDSKMQNHLKIADEYLAQLDGQ